MSRLFVALNLPDAAKDVLTQLPGDLPEARWTDSDAFHLTLRFFGEASDREEKRILAALERVESPAFLLSLSGLGLFPLRGDPEVLWVGVKENPLLLQLRHRIEAALAAEGLNRDSRKFHPHVTLARLDEGPIDRLAQYLKQHALFKLDEMPITSFSLFSSQLTPGGAHYTEEAVYPLYGLVDGDDLLEQDADSQE